MAQILVIEDNQTMREGISQILSKLGHDIRAASNGKQGIQMFSESMADFVITDLKMEEGDGMEVLQKIREMSSEALIMIMTAFGTIETAVEAMKLGAFDFITKPFSPDLLRMKVSSAIEFSKTRAENRFLRAEIRKEVPEVFIGNSGGLHEVREQIEKVAKTGASVLITGESGTGKELVARAIHGKSNRSEKPFIKVDCASLAEGVLESELFGHERGAFTGAIQRRAGRFELADGGTIFLDEIGEVPIGIQTKLLRVLQDRCFERVGGTRTLQVDVRLISATNKNLAQAIAEGRFREDLFYRLQVVPIQIPPLRERREDILELTNYFLHRLTQRTGRQLELSAEAKLALQSYSWPGNIRELEHLLERIHVLAKGNEITLDSLPENLKKSNNQVYLELPAGSVSLNDALEELERQLIVRAYRQAKGVKTKTAELLGIKPSALYYKLEKYGITE